MFADVSFLADDLVFSLSHARDDCATSFSKPLGYCEESCRITRGMCVLHRLNRVSSSKRFSAKVSYSIRDLDRGWEVMLHTSMIAYLLLLTVSYIRIPQYISSVRN